MQVTSGCCGSRPSDAPVVELLDHLIDLARHEPVDALLQVLKARLELRLAGVVPVGRAEGAAHLVGCCDHFLLVGAERCGQLRTSAGLALTISFAMGGLLPRGAGCCCQNRVPAGSLGGALEVVADEELPEPQRRDFAVGSADKR